MKTSEIIQMAALFKNPNEPWRVGSWLPKHAYGDEWNAILDRLATLEEWWDRKAPIEARRMFLLLVSMERAEIEAANEAAYHGDIDGDFDY